MRRVTAGSERENCTLDLLRQIERALVGILYFIGVTHFLAFGTHAVCDTIIAKKEGQCLPGVKPLNLHFLRTEGH